MDRFTNDHLFLHNPSFLFLIFLLVSQIGNSLFKFPFVSSSSSEKLVMFDSWIDEVHEAARWLCRLFLFALLSLGSSDRSHNAPVHHVISTATE